MTINDFWRIIRDKPSPIKLVRSISVKYEGKGQIENGIFTRTNV